MAHSGKKKDEPISRQNALDLREKVLESLIHCRKAMEKDKKIDYRSFPSVNQDNLKRVIKAFELDSLRYLNGSGNDLSKLDTLIQEIIAGKPLAIDRDGKLFDKETAFFQAEKKQSTSAPKKPSEEELKEDRQEIIDRAASIQKKLKLSYKEGHSKMLEKEKSLWGSLFGVYNERMFSPYGLTEEDQTELNHVFSSLNIPFSESKGATCIEALNLIKTYLENYKKNSQYK